MEICNPYIIQQARFFQGRLILKSFGNDKKQKNKREYSGTSFLRGSPSVRIKTVDGYFFLRAMLTYRGKACKTEASPEQANCNDEVLVIPQRNQADKGARTVAQAARD